MPTEVFSHKRAEPETRTDFRLKPRRLTARPQGRRLAAGSSPFLSAVDLRERGPAPELMRAYAKFGAWVAEIDLWSAQALSPEEAAWLAELPMTARVGLGPGATLLCAHGSPSSYNQRLTPDMPDDALRAALDGLEREPGVVALACGHTHTPMVRALDDLTVINPGSVGLPMAKDAEGASYNPAGYAEYAVVTWEKGALTVDLRRVALDADAVRADVAASALPRADRWRSDMRRN